MGFQLLNLPDECSLALHTDYVIDTFKGLNTDLWTTTATGTGAASNTVASSAGSLEQLSSGTTSGGDCILESDFSVYCNSSSPSVSLTQIIELTEGNTDDAIAFVGLGDSQDNALPIDAAGAVNGNLNFAAGFYKLAGETRWSFLVKDSSGTSSKALNLDVSSGSKVAFRIDLFLNESGILVVPAVATNNYYDFRSVSEYGSSPRSPDVSFQTAATNEEIVIVDSVESSSANAEILQIYLAILAGGRL